MTRAERQAKWARDDYKRDPKRQRNAALKHRYGITQEQYECLLEAQSGRCAICEQLCLTGRRLSVDHSHETSEVRGLLCGNCNRGLGMFKDLPERLAKAIIYLSGSAASPDKGG